MRKIVQLVTSPAITPGNAGLLYALCDDGSLWWKTDELGNPWKLEEPIPQGTDEKWNYEGEEHA